MQSTHHPRWWTKMKAQKTADKSLFCILFWSSLQFFSRNGWPDHCKLWIPEYASEDLIIFSAFFCCYELGVYTLDKQTVMDNIFEPDVVEFTGMMSKSNFRSSDIRYEWNCFLTDQWISCICLHGCHTGFQTSTSLTY